MLPGAGETGVPGEEHFEVELNSWHPRKSNKGPGRGPKPVGWVNDHEQGFGNNAWPFNPSGPEGAPFTDGDYVVIRGTLWQDSGHPDTHPWRRPWDHAFPNHGGYLEIHPVDDIRRLITIR